MGVGDHRSEEAEGTTCVGFTSHLAHLGSFNLAIFVTLSGCETEGKRQFRSDKSSACCTLSTHL